MCSTCGCGSDVITITKIGKEALHEHYHPSVLHPNDHQYNHDHQHTHAHDHHHSHHHHSPSVVKTVIELERDILSKNNLLAERNRGYFEGKNIFAINLVSSPGSGKTTILERSLSDLKDEINAYVIEGDQHSTNDADRIAKTDVPVVQVNTGKGCHLDANMIHQSLKQLKPTNNSLLFIENVGNLVCPALFDLGENKRVVIISVTEGDDKPIKYADMFHTSGLCLINKIDLLPYVQFDVEKMKEYAKRIKPNLKFIEISATTGKGMNQWYDWLKTNVIE